MKNIAFLGVGGVGGYFGGKMTQLLSEGRHDINVYFIARGQHLEVIKENGLILKTKTDGVFKCVPTLATDRIEELPKLDVCFICVKQYALEDAVREILPRIDIHTKIIPLLNGIDIYDRIRAVTDKGIIFPACVYIGTHIESSGVIAQDGGACTIIFGQDPSRKDINGDDICELMDKASIKYEWTNKHIEAIWSKYMFIASYGLITASENMTLGEVLNDEEVSKKVKGIMNEIVAISKAENILLSDHIVESSFAMAGNFPYEAKTSFQRDVEIKDKPDERELFGQTIIDLGAKHHIETPVVKSIYHKLK